MAKQLHIPSTNSSKDTILYSQKGIPQPKLDAPSNDGEIFSKLIGTANVVLFSLKVKKLEFLIKSQI